MIKRSEIVKCARSWKGTPYKHQSSLKGVGADCLGVVRGVWKEIFGEEPEQPSPYTPGWDDFSKDDILLKKAFEHLVPVDNYRSGDVLVFRMAIGAAAKHMAIATTDGMMVHAINGSVCSEVFINEIYSRRLVKSFSFPGVDI